MDITELKELVIKALELYDKSNTKYAEYINSKFNIMNELNDYGHFELHDKKINANYQIIGYYDIINKIWIWGWVTQIHNNLTELSRELLDYGLKLDVASINAEQIYLKGLLLNSRYIVNEKISLDINIAIFLYILNKKILFIYPKKTEDKIIYYFIYNLNT